MADEMEDKVGKQNYATGGSDVESVQGSAQRGVSVDTKDEHGMTDLMACVSSGEVDGVRQLVYRGADVNEVDKNGKTALMYAAEGGNTDIARLLIESGPDVNAVDTNGKTSLMHAAERGDVESLWLLIDRGADVNVVDNDGSTALVYALRSGSMDAVRFLVVCGADVGAVDKFGKTALMFASDAGELGVVRLLVDHGADVNAVDDVGKTALTYASEADRKGVVGYLSDRTGDVNAVDTNGQTRLIHASKAGEFDVVRFLVDHGADVNAVDTDGKTALTYASKKGDMDIVRFLVERGADVRIDDDGKTLLSEVIITGQNGPTNLVRTKDLFPRSQNPTRLSVIVKRNGKAVERLIDASIGGDKSRVCGSPKRGDSAKTLRSDGSADILVLAAFFGQVDAMRLAINNGVDVNAGDKNGVTALMSASEGGRMDAVKYLIGRGADVNAVDCDGKTALVYALEEGNLDAVQFLVDRRADVNAADKDGVTALMYAVKRVDMSAIEFLVWRGAGVNAVDGDGKTALMYAAEGGSMEVVKCLLERGADANNVNEEVRCAAFLAASKGHTAIERFLMSLLQADIRAIGLIRDGRQEPLSLALSSWFISPFEIDLQGFIDRQDDGGVQFRAKWLDADVAVKLFIPSASKTSFADEVTVWHKLRHPNVIRLYGACDFGHSFFVCELASNGSVVEHLTACRRNGLKGTPWKFLHQAALGLVYLHERKLVHGDLRGSNILIGSDGLAKLNGFSQSVLTRARDLAGTVTSVFGSARWQSPERVAGGEATFVSDVYSLGLCVMEVVSGEIPWKEVSDTTTKAAKNNWDPAACAISAYVRGPLAVDVVDLIVRMCALDPTRRVSAAVAAQMLERLSAKEHQGASQQPESEPQTSIDEYKGGELRRLWDGMHTRMSTVGADSIQNHVFEEIQAMFKHLGQASQPWKVLVQFHSLLIDIDSMLQTDSYENQIQRLSSTRATGFAMDAIRRRLDALWVSIDGSQFRSRESQKKGWREERAKQLDLFVSEVEQTLLVLNELETEEDRVALLAVLKSEKNNPMSKYTPGELSVINKAYDDLIQRQRQKQDVTKSDVVTTTPEWFLPWYELEIDKANCVEAGGFGGVYRARWLDSEVIVKLLDQGGSGNMSNNSFASDVSSYWSSTRMTSSDPTTREEEKAKMREMFAHEVRIWFGLSHPHVVRLFGACHVGTLVFACEFASNGSLDSYLWKQPDELWRKLYEAALGVQYLHARGIIHGDLKCNNILVGSDGKAKVTDFGLSVDTAVLDKTGAQVSGAGQWVAPECMEHGSIRLSSASDVYSLGMCIIEALRVVEATTSKEKESERAIVPLPWGSLDIAIVKHHVLKGTLPLRPSVCTDEQWTLVTRMSAFNPSDRLNIGTVVDILGRLAGVDVSSDSMAGTHANALELEDISAAVAEMKSCIDAEQVTGSSSRKTLTQIFGLLWSRLDDISRVLDDGSCGDVGRLWELVDRSRQSTMALQEQSSSESLIAFTETAMRGYALHRGLDNLIDANAWPIDSGEGSDVHDWRRRCSEFYGVGG